MDVHSFRRLPIYVYQWVAKKNHDLELVPVGKEAFGAEYATYDPINVCKDDPVLEAIVDNISAGDVFFDVGAHVGNYSFTMAGLDATAYAFEPDPEMYEHLQRNAEVNPGLDVHPKRIAVSDDEGEVTFYRSGDRGSGSLTQANAARHGVAGDVTVRAATLDGLAEELTAPDVVKIDAEGQLIDVLEGGRRVLEECRPLVYFETHNHHEGIDYADEAYEEIFHRYGYRIADGESYGVADPG